MEVTKKSILSGIVHKLNLNITDEQWNRYLLGEEHIQYIFPDFTAAEREFLISGITAEEWEEAFFSQEE